VAGDTILEGDDSNNTSFGYDNNSNNNHAPINQLQSENTNSSKTSKIDFKVCGFDSKSKYLTAKAFSLDVEDVTLEEARFSSMMANLLCQLTQTQQKLLAEILSYASNAKDPNRSIFKRTRLPVSQEDFEDIFISGKNSIIWNLPHPVPKHSEDGTHAYVTLTDVLANEMAAGTLFDNFFFESTIQLEEVDKDPPSVSTMASACHLFFELKEQATEEDPFIMYLRLKERRADFDPNNTKSSRNQVWINTFTICPSSSEKNGRNTYFMAISNKGDDHSEIEQIFVDEVNKLATEGAYFYHGNLQKMIKVKLGKILTCIDRPERTSMFHIGHHAGTFSGNFGYAGSVDGKCKENNLPSCTFCRKERLLRIQNSETTMSGTIHTCDQNMCSDWSTMDKAFSFPAPAHYPTQYDKNEAAPLPPAGREIIMLKQSNESKKRKRQKQHPINQRLLTVKLTVVWLQQAITFAHHNVKTLRFVHRGTTRMWTKQNVFAYLRSCGITKKWIDDVYSSAMKLDDVPPIPKT
jgi:hypothetical protein